MAGTARGTRGHLTPLVATAGGAARSVARPAVRDLLLPLAAALGCLGAVLAASVLGPVDVRAGSPLDRLVLGGAPIEAPATEGDGGAASEEDPPPTPEADGGIPVEVVVSLAAAVVAGALLARSLLRARPGEPAAQEEPEPDQTHAHGPEALDEVADAARRGLVRLDGTPAGGAEGAVLACWADLEAAGSRVGSGRAVTDTPTDFGDRLAAAVPGLDTDVLDGLRRTYSRVRYGSQGARPDDVRRARAALEHLLVVLDDAGRTRDPGHGRGGTGPAAGTHTVPR